MTYFRFDEFIKSDRAKLNGLENYPTDPAHLRNLGNLWHVLDCVRSRLGAPIFINSAYRTPQVNKLVGGVDCSLHMKGLAADIRTFPNKMKLLRDILDTYELEEFIDYETFYHIAI